MVWVETVPLFSGLPNANRLFKCWVDAKIVVLVIQRNRSSPTIVPLGPRHSDDTACIVGGLLGVSCILGRGHFPEVCPPIVESLTINMVNSNWVITSHQLPDDSMCQQVRAAQT